MHWLISSRISKRTVLLFELVSHDNFTIYDEDFIYLNVILYDSSPHLNNPTYFLDCFSRPSKLLICSTLLNNSLSITIYKLSSWTLKNSSSSDSFSSWSILQTGIINCLSFILKTIGMKASMNLKVYVLKRFFTKYYSFVGDTNFTETFSECILKPVNLSSRNFPLTLEWISIVAPPSW